MNAKDSLQLAEHFSSNQKAKMGEFQASTCEWRRYLEVGKNIWGPRTLTPHLVSKGIVDLGRRPPRKARRVCCEAPHPAARAQICRGPGCGLLPTHPS